MIEQQFKSSASLSRFIAQRNSVQSVHLVLIQLVSWTSLVLLTFPFVP